jgi:hypothetical protein
MMLMIVDDVDDSWDTFKLLSISSTSLLIYLLVHKTSNVGKFHLALYLPNISNNLLP